MLIAHDGEASVVNIYMLHLNAVVLKSHVGAENLV